MRSLGWLALLMGVSLPAVAGAQSEHESPISGIFDLRVGTWSPAIDDEAAFKGTTGPYESVFGSDSLLYFEGLWGRELYRGVGSFGLELGVGYGGVSGSARTADGSRSPDETSLRLVPLRAGLFYRFDWLERRFSVPVTVAVDAGFADVLWWVNATDGVSDWANDAGKRYDGRGATMGTYSGATLYLSLDALAPRMASNFDSNSGVNNSYLFASYVSTRADDFGDKKSWDLSSDTALFGLGFEY